MPRSAVTSNPYRSCTAYHLQNKLVYGSMRHTPAIMACGMSVIPSCRTSCNICMLICILLCRPAQTHVPRALVILFLESTPADAIQGARAIVKSEIRHARGYFSDKLAFLTLGAHYSSNVQSSLRSAGWSIRWLHQFTHNDESVLLHMPMYDEIVYMDLRAVFVSDITTPFTSFNSNCCVWACLQDAHIDANSIHNLDVIAIRPKDPACVRIGNLSLASMHSFMDIARSLGGVCMMDFEKNANAEMYRTHQEYWNASVIEVVRFTTPPWNCSYLVSPICKLWIAEFNSPVWPVTVVSAYYVGHNKHGHDSYVRWSRNFLKQNVPMVIFTDNSSLVSSLYPRNLHNTRICEAHMSSFIVSLHRFDWDRQLKIDPHGVIHGRGPHLYKIWLEKTNFVKRAIVLNAFRSSHFIWVDFGCFRDDSEFWVLHPWVIHVSRFPSDTKILVFDFPGDGGDYPRVAGTIFGGHRKAWVRWHHAFYYMLRHYYDRGEFIGDDQIVMTHLANHYPALLCRIQSRTNFGNPWWYLQYYLSGIEGALEQQCKSPHAAKPIIYSK